MDPLPHSLVSPYFGFGGLPPLGFLDGSTGTKQILVYSDWPDLDVGVETAAATALAVLVAGFVLDIRLTRNSVSLLVLSSVLAWPMWWLVHDFLGSWFRGDKVSVHPPGVPDRSGVSLRPRLPSDGLAWVPY